MDYLLVELLNWGVFLYKEMLDFCHLKNNLIAYK